MYKAHSYQYKEHSLQYKVHSLQYKVQIRVFTLDTVAILLESGVKQKL